MHPCLDVSRQEKVKYLVQLKKDVGKIAEAPRKSESNISGIYKKVQEYIPFFLNFPLFI